MFYRKAIILTILFLSAAFAKADDLNTKKMESVTRQILDIFVNDKYTDKSEPLRKFVSEEWLDKKKINLKNFQINNYAPTTYTIVYSGGDICAATIGRKGWSHLLVFKFTEEWNNYRVIPRGISETSSDYIDPWWFVQDYICSDAEEEK